MDFYVALTTWIIQTLICSRRQIMQYISTAQQTVASIVWIMSTGQYPLSNKYVSSSANLDCGLNIQTCSFLPRCSFWICNSNSIFPDIRDKIEYVSDHCSSSWVCCTSSMESYWQFASYRILKSADLGQRLQVSRIIYDLLCGFGRDDPHFDWVIQMMQLYTQQSCRCWCNLLVRKGNLI